MPFLEGMTLVDSDLAILASELRKSYFIAPKKSGAFSGLRQLVSSEKREIKAVDGISFKVEKGGFIGYIGPNGAGKSTTVKMLSGILHPTSGKVEVNGISPVKERRRLARQIGIVFGQRTQLWWDLPTIDSFEILSAMYDVPPGEYKSFLKRFDDLLELGEFLETPVRRLSLGQRMRADLAAAMIHRPSVLFLDEPTIGLDVVAKGRIREFLARLNSDEGITVLLTTHDLRDIEELCQRIMVISHGSLIHDGNVETLRSLAGLRTILRVKYASAIASDAKPGRYLDARGILSETPDVVAWQVTRVDAASKTVDVSFDRTRSTVPAVLTAMQGLGEVRDVSMAEPSIDDIVKRLLIEDERGEPTASLRTRAL